MTLDLYTDLIEPVDLTGYTRAALADQQQNQFTLSRFLPNKPIDDLDYRFRSGGAGLVEAAQYRQYDTPAPFGKRAGGRTVSGELPPISRQLRLSEYDRIRRRAANANDALLDVIFSDAEALARQIAARIELARGDALVNGSVTISENGVNAAANFGRSGSHSVSAGTAWSTVATATALSDYASWVDTYVATNGVKPDVSATSTRVLRYMQRNAEIINAVAGAAAERTRVNLSELNDLLQSEGLPPVEVYDAQVKVNGSATRVIADDKFVMIGGNIAGQNELGATLLGPTSESMESEYGLAPGDQPGIVAGVYRSNQPVALYTVASAIGLPVLANPDLTFVADVA